jgi:exopolysaccharide biosynthesis polyprenyl glycosylphosphotransferase
VTLATKPADSRPAPLSEDVRARRPYLFSAPPLKGVARRLASVAALVFLDVVGIALGLYAALVLRELAVGNRPVLWGFIWREAEAKWLPFLVLVMILVFWRNGLYSDREHRAGFGRIVGGLLLVTAIALAFGIGTGYHFSTYAIFPTAFVTSTVLVGILRGSYDVMTKDIFRVAGIRRRALLVGSGEDLTQLHTSLGEARGGIEYEFLGAVAPSQDRVDLPVLGSFDELPDLVASQEVDELIVTDSDFDEETLLEIVEAAHRSGVKVRVAPKTTELLTQRAEYVPGQGVPLFELRPPVFAGAEWLMKRLFDLVVSAAVIALLLPLWLLIALAIKLTSRGSILYRDRRIGLAEHEFGMLKFRTMYRDAAQQQQALETQNEAGGALFKIRDDPRVTPVGKLLRRFSLDEAPQVLNVLWGEMSLVGPRPLPVRDYGLLDEWHRKRYLVLPGMTGLWQISGRSSLTFDDLVRLDFYYLENWSVWLDITILAKTLPAVLSRRGAY